MNSLKTKLLIASFASFIAISARAPATSLSIDTKSIVSVEGVVDRPMADSVTKRIRSLAFTGKKTVSTINIYINSPGGSVAAGDMIIHEMEKAKAAGVSFSCYVDDMAASMAFQILTYCNNRYAFPTSRLLWHPVRVVLLRQVMTPKVSYALAQDLIAVEKELLRPLLSVLNLSPKTFFYHYHKETFHSGFALKRLDSKYLNLISGINNYKEVLAEVKKQKPARGMFGLFGNERSNKAYKIEYIYRGK